MQAGSGMKEKEETKKGDPNLGSQVFDHLGRSTQLQGQNDEKIGYPGQSPID